MEYAKDPRFHFIPDREVEEELLKIAQLPRVAIDTETHYIPDDKKITRFLTEHDVPNNTPFLLTLSDGKVGWAIELNATTIPVVKTFLENPISEKVFFNASYDLEMLLNIGIKVQGKIHDVMIMHHLIDEEDTDEEGKLIRGLKPLAVKYLRQDSDVFEKMVDKVRARLAKERKVNKEQISYYDVYLDSPEVMVDYASADTLFTMQLFDLWEPYIEEEGLTNIYQIEMACVWAVVHAEMRGYKIDKPRLKEVKAELSKNVEKYTEEIYACAGEKFNINSDEQLVAVFQKLGAEYTAMTEKGNWQTNKDALQPFLEHDLEPVRKLAEAVLRYREEDKLLNTFIAGIERYLQADGRVHPFFWQAGTRTGRMSSSKPNFQNFINDDRIKSLFIPEEGYILVAADAAQQEYRMLAHYAKEWTLIDMIKKGYDVHKATAALVFNVPYEEVSPEERRIGKTTNFALVYGLGLAAIAKTFGQKIDEEKYKLANEVFRRLNLKPWALPALDILLLKVKDEKEQEALRYYFSEECKQAITFAKEKKAAYFAKLPNVEQFLKDAKKACQRRGWVKTWSGRKKRYKDPYREAYKAPNAIIQGGCGDFLKDKAGKLYKLLEGKKSGIINFIHDAFYFEIHTSELDLLPKIKAILEESEFRVPIDFDFKWSDTNEAELKEWSDGDWKLKIQL